MDNDVGEHWFDNWDLRESIEKEAEKLGLDSTELFVLDPERFEDGRDGPCHSPGDRILFWKDVLMSLKLSLATLIREARTLNEENRQLDLEQYIPDLEYRIEQLQIGFKP